MNKRYNSKYLIIVLSGIMWFVSFAILFIGGTVMQNRIALAINIVLIVLQILNVYRAFFVVNQKDAAIVLGVCLLFILMLMWATYMWGWSYTVKALTIGFE